MRLILVSNNNNKISELKRFFEPYGYELVSLAEAAAFAGMEALGDVAETENTYFGNAKLKADAGFAWAGRPVVADDSGLEVRALGGAPGVFSARYGGSGLTSAERNEALLDRLEGVEDRFAVLRTMLCAKFAPEQYVLSEGIFEGHIAEAPRGESGWGYEPLFVPTASSLTIAEMRDQGVVFRSHRYAAATNLVALLNSLRGGSEAERTSRRSSAPAVSEA